MNLLTEKHEDKSHSVLRRWTGHYREWDIEVLQSTNDSQWHCPPWGSISDVEFLGSDAGEFETIAKVISDLLETPPSEDAESKWRFWVRRDGSVWYAALGVDNSSSLRLQLGCASSSDLPAHPRSTAAIREHLRTIFTEDDGRDRLKDAPPDI
jgi:hypothetical protein